MRECVIIAARPVDAWLAARVPKDAYIIAADAGWRRARELGLEPDLVVGDFDSAPPPEDAPECICLPREKDDTDMHFAAREAVCRGMQSVTLLGGTGGRADHTLANYATLLFLAQQGVCARMIDAEAEVLCCAPGVLELERREGCYVSVFAAGGEAGGVWLEGLKYPLEDAVLTPEHPLGTSNEFAADRACIRHEQGYLLVVVAKRGKDEAIF